MIILYKIFQTIGVVVFVVAVGIAVYLGWSDLVHQIHYDYDMEKHNIVSYATGPLSKIAYTLVMVALESFLAMVLVLYVKEELL